LDLDDQAVLVLLGELVRGADDLLYEGSELDALNSGALGQTVFLKCIEHEYNQPKGAPQAAEVDFDRKLVSTPVGAFQIDGGNERVITFKGEDPLKGLDVWGYLHRFDGDMDIFWGRKMSPVLGRFFKCEVHPKPKRLF
jgi:hypothetical protein